MEPLSTARGRRPLRALYGVSQSDPLVYVLSYVVKLGQLIETYTYRVCTVCAAATPHGEGIKEGGHTYKQRECAAYS